jgi:hypothetical protein
MTSNEIISQAVARSNRSNPKGSCKLHGIINVLVRHFVLGVDLHSSQVDLKHHGLCVAFMGLERLLANPKRSESDTLILQIAMGSELCAGLTFVPSTNLNSAVGASGRLCMSRPILSFGLAF